MHPRSEDSLWARGSGWRCTSSSSPRPGSPSSVGASRGRLPISLERVTPWVFAVFVACFAVYRLGLASARKYPASKAFFQVGLTVVVFLLLLPSSRAPYIPAGTALGQALVDPDPRLRALAAEVARYRPEGRGYVSPVASRTRTPPSRPGAPGSLSALPHS